MIIKSTKDIKIPEWAKSMAQDEDGQICAYECALSELMIRGDTFVGGYYYCEKYASIYETIQEGFNDGTRIEGWERRAYDLTLDNVSIDNEILLRLGDT